MILYDYVKTNYLYRSFWIVIGIIPITFPSEDLEMELFFVLARQEI